MTIGVSKQRVGKTTGLDHTLLSGTMSNNNNGGKFKPASEMLSRPTRTLPKSTVASLTSLTGAGASGGSGASGSSSSASASVSGKRGGAGAGSSRVAVAVEADGLGLSASMGGRGLKVQQTRFVAEPSVENKGERSRDFDDKNNNDSEEDDSDDDPPTYEESTKDHLNIVLDHIKTASPVPDLGTVSSARIAELLSIGLSIIKDNPGECICKYPIQTQEVMLAYLALARASEHNEFPVIRCPNSNADSPTGSDTQVTASAGDSKGSS
jgi:hypothetical protein